MTDREKIKILRDIITELEKINHMIATLGDAIYLEAKEKKEKGDNETDDIK